jgi:hypothetical protein
MKRVVLGALIGVLIGGFVGALGLLIWGIAGKWIFIMTAGSGLLPFIGIPLIGAMVGGASGAIVGTIVALALSDE